MTDQPTYGKERTGLGYITVTPMPSQDELDRFYSEDYYQQQVATTYQAEYSDDELRQKRLRSELLVHAAGAARGKRGDGAKLLDVGCGEGFVLAAAVSGGYEVAGLEFSDYAVKKFHPDLAEKVEFGNPFDLLEQRIKQGDHVDVCTLQNVVEHVREPLELLSRVKTLIGKDGLAVVTVPNDYSPMQKRAKELGFIKDEYWFAPPQHLQYFDCDSIRDVVRSIGFEVVDAYGDFPIEMFLFHPGSNYALDRAQGKAAHNARVTLDLMLADRGLEPYHQFCKAMTACGIGRNITVILRASTP